MANYWHVEWLKEGVVRWNKRRKKVRFSPDLSGIRFFEHLPKDFRDVPKTSRYFERFDLTEANLEQSDLSGLNFSGAKFTGANLHKANLSKSNFRGASFLRANLTEADASSSYFDGAVFEDSVVELLNLEGADIQGATFIGMKIAEEQIKAAQGNPQILVSRKDMELISYAMTAAESSPSAKREEESRTKKFRYDVFYGTNRSPTIERGAIVGFDDAMAQDLSYGLCEVIVPEGHQIGKIGTSLLGKLFNKKSGELRIESTIPLDKDLFWYHLLATSEKMKEKARPTIFVHGYNSSFKTSVLRAAQIGYDLGIGQGIGLFSWPSKGRPLHYAADEASAEARKYYLADFIEGFVGRGTDLGINIIAHSMGCRVLLGALEELTNRRSDAIAEIHQVIMAAADVDAQIMPRLGLHAVRNSERITSYVSGIDRALALSGWLHSYPRVGVTPPTFVMQDMDTVVVNDMNLGDFAHSYLGSSRVILNDIYHILLNGLSPERRHSLVKAIEGPMEFWRIRN